MMAGTLANWTGTGQLELDGFLIWFATGTTVSATTMVSGRSGLVSQANIHNSL